MIWREAWEELRSDPEHRAYVLAEEAKHSVATRVYALRTERGLSQEELARLAQTKQPSISDIERADANPTIETLGKLAAALGVNVTDLLDDSADHGQETGAQHRTKSALRTNPTLP